LIRRRFLLKSIMAAMATPLLGVTGCDDVFRYENSETTSDPEPIPESDAVIILPNDHYQHSGAPTEWWWHIGTLYAGDRIFGFEINAASFQKDGFAFTQIMLADVSNNRTFQRTTPYIPPLVFNADSWAEKDATKDWSVKLGDESSYLSAIELIDPGSGYTSTPLIEISGGGGSSAQAMALMNLDAGEIAIIVLTVPGVGYTSEPTITITGGGGSGAQARAIHTYVSMHSSLPDPTQNMIVKAELVDEKTNAVVKFDLKLSEQGHPFIVWGTGVQSIYPSETATALEQNNYYYSLTHLQADGTIELDGETIEVTGVTWMDHEYGAFGTEENPVKWILQDMQLDNGVSISNFALLGSGPPPPLNQKTESKATVQREDGTTYFVDSFTTPIGRTWTSTDSDKTYFMQLQIDIPSFDATIIVTSLMDAQEFPVKGGPVYEGVASASGTFEGQEVSGTAWNEQTLR